MTTPQLLVLALLLGIMIMFVWGRIRYDLVAFSGLLVAVVLDLIPAKQAFLGFSNSAVITVAAVLIISRGLEVSGAIDRIAHFVVPKVKNLSLQITSLTSFAGALSAVMNNVGALALLMPATIDAAKRQGKSPSLLLMPLSFGSILGGMITLIGTPPNIIIASFREEALGAPYSMFDFSPVGLVIAGVGILYLATIGWRLVPTERKGKSASDDLLDIDKYLSEVVVNEDSRAIDKTVRELDQIFQKFDVQIAGLIRNHKRILRPARKSLIEAGDILIVEVDPTDLDKFAHETGLTIKGDVLGNKDMIQSDDIMLIEAVIADDSRLVGRISGELRLKSRQGINLLGVSRQGKTIRKRLHKITFHSGDVILFQADTEAMAQVMPRLGLMPLATRDVIMGKRGDAWMASLFLAGGILLASLGVLDLTISLSAAALLMVLTHIVPARDIYTSIDWPVIVLVGCMLPLGATIQTTGLTEVIANEILGLSSGLTPTLILALILIVTMTLSDVMNNTATAVVMAPVALTIATTLNVNPDAFLMAVAIGASCAFLTPIGHKNNALVMGPGGYHFGDYWRMGLPLEIIIVIVGVPTIQYFWPL
jgi:di/tricarboxylate transporter